MARCCPFGYICDGATVARNQRSSVKLRNELGVGKSRVVSLGIGSAADFGSNLACSAVSHSSKRSKGDCWDRKHGECVLSGISSCNRPERFSDNSLHKYFDRPNVNHRNRLQFYADSGTDYRTYCWAPPL